MKDKDSSGTAKTYLVEVSVVSKAPTQETLSYFSGERVPVGTFVRVPLRRSTTVAVVVSSKDVRHARSDIRRAGFVLRKIRKSDILDATLSPETCKALAETARRYATPFGVFLAGILPKAFLEEPNIFLPNTEKKRKASDEVKETILLQMEREERFGQYRALVRQAFARGESTIFVVPTALEIPRACIDLSRGIEEFVHLFALSKKSEVKKLWHKALEDKHPILFITTPAGLLLPRSDVGTIIVERENSRAYRTLAKPFIHWKVLVEAYAKAAGRQLALGDSVLSLETLWREKQGEFGESSLIRWRLPAAPTQLVDAKRGAEDKATHFDIFSPELKAFMQKALEESGKMFLFGARKGLAPTTLCSDCGTILPCLNCGAGVVLHQQGEHTIYICHACGSRRDSTTTCGYCGSWKLTPLGIGTEEIAARAHELFPYQQIFILDKDYAPTDAKAAIIVKKWRAEGGILIGTELSFFHLESVFYSAIVSLDTLFSIPDFGINERIFYLVSRLREITKQEVLVQTRNIGKQILAWASFGNIIDFYQSEIGERQILLYPPFSIFIKITPLNVFTKEDLLKLKEHFREWQPDILRNSVVMRLPREMWPAQDLLEKLTLLGPTFSIKVDPESIL